ncbi:hypothetical protein COL13_26340 [Bacillus cereus]|nr:hypothetical protein COL13_26340 [Bacillus cereus]
MKILQGKIIDCICPICIKRWEFEHEGIPHHDKLFTCMIGNEDRTVEVICEECEIGLEESINEA